MTNLEDLIWLYKMALEFNLEDEKRWLKVVIEERMKQTTPHKTDMEELATEFSFLKDAA